MGKLGHYHRAHVIVLVSVIPYEVRLTLLNEVRRQLQILLAVDYGQLLVAAYLVVVSGIPGKHEHEYLFCIGYRGTVGIGQFPAHEQAAIGGLCADVKYTVGARNSIIAFGSYGAVCAVVAANCNLYSLAESRRYFQAVMEAVKAAL